MTFSSAETKDRWAFKHGVDEAVESTRGPKGGG